MALQKLQTIPSLSESFRVFPRPRFIFTAPRRHARARAFACTRVVDYVCACVRACVRLRAGAGLLVRVRARAHDTHAHACARARACAQVPRDLRQSAQSLRGPAARPCARLCGAQIIIKSVHGLAVPQSSARPCSAQSLRGPAARPCAPQGRTRVRERTAPTCKQTHRHERTEATTIKQAPIQAVRPRDCASRCTVFTM